MEESSGNLRKIEVCHSPALFDAYFEDEDCTVVVIDVFRATSAMVTAFAHGVEKMIPVSSMEEAERYRAEGYLTAAERKGEKVEGYALGNSPFHYMDEGLQGKSIVITTTNGTKAIEVASKANHVLLGSFLNLKAVAEQVEKLDKDVMLLCAGWKDRYNLEDTLVAGALVEIIEQNLRFGDYSDSAISARQLYRGAKEDLYAYLEDSSHRRRLSRLNMEEDIIFCLKHNEYNIVPYLKDGVLITSGAMVETE